MNKKNKSGYYNYRLNIKKDDSGDENKYQNETNSKVMWETFKKLTNSSKQVPPRVILYDGNMVTSIKKLLILRMNFFLTKSKRLGTLFWKIAV